MAPRSSRILILGVATLVVLLSISGLAFAQTDDSASGPTTSRSSETVVLSDTFDDPATGIIPPLENAAEDFSAEYDSGLFDVDALADDFSGAFAIQFGDSYTDVTIAVDAVLSGGIEEEPGRYIFLSCRVGEDGGGYRLEFRPQIAAVVLRKLDSETGQQIASAEMAEAVPVTDQARLELRCNGSTISAKVNGQDVVTAAVTTGLAFFAPSLRHIDAAILNAISDESTSWYEPKVSATLMSTSG